MFRLNPITLEYEWIPRSLCFIEGEGGEDGGDPPSGGEGGEGDPPKGEEGDPPKGEEGDPPKAETADWRAGISEDMKATADRFDSPDAMARAIVDLRKRESQVRVPGEGADEKEIAAYNKAIGVPETAAEYAFPELDEEDMTDAIKADREQWANFFHEKSVPKPIADAMVARFYEQQDAAQKAILAEDQKYADEQEEALKQKWQGDEFEKNRQFANNALAELANRTGGDLEALKQIETKAGRFLLDDAAIVQLFAAVGREMQTGTLGMPMSQTERETVDGELEALQKQIDAAQAAGQSKKANELYQKKLALIEKRDGTEARAA